MKLNCRQETALDGRGGGPWGTVHTKGGPPGLSDKQAYLANTFLLHI